MAKLPQASSGTGLQIKDLAPDGQHIAVCLRVADLFQVERPTFENKNVKEITDVTRFVYGLIGQDGKPYIVQTYEFTISGAPGANLMKFLKQWLGRDAEVGWDYSEMLNKGAMITIQRKGSKTKPGQFYANITGISPVHAQLTAHIPNPQVFAAMLAELDRGGGQQNTPPPAQPGPSKPYPPVTPPATQTLPPPPQQAAPRKIFVHVNGQATPMEPTALAHLVATGQGGLPAIYEGDAQWSTVATLAPKAAPTLPPAFPPVTPPPPVAGAAAPLAGGPVDEDVPF